MSAMEIAPWWVGTWPLRLGHPLSLEGFRVRSPFSGEEEGEKPSSSFGRAQGSDGSSGAPADGRNPRVAARLPSACSKGLLEFWQEKQKCCEVIEVHPQGTPFCCLAARIGLSEGYRFGDAFNKGTRTVIGCQSLPKPACRLSWECVLSTT